MVAASMLKIMVLCLGVFWIVSFSVGRIFVFYETYTETMRLLQDETWLRLQCSDPSFYSNIRQHADLCTGVQRNFERGAILVALNAVANTAQRHHDHHRPTTDRLSLSRRALRFAASCLPSSVRAGYRT